MFDERRKQPVTRDCSFAITASLYPFLMGFVVVSGRKKAWCVFTKSEQQRKLRI
jgi:hypothetical protein